MAITIVELSFSKALNQAPLSGKELDKLKELSAVELLDMGTLSEVVAVKQWCQREEFRHRAQAQLDRSKEFSGYPKPPTRSYPYYE